MFCVAVFCYLVQMHKTDKPDLGRIRKEAKNRRRTEGRASYMQYLDQVAREFYGVRHFHEAQKVSRQKSEAVVVSPTQYYLRTLQEYYLDL